MFNLLYFADNTIQLCQNGEVIQNISDSVDSEIKVGILFFGIY